MFNQLTKRIEICKDEIMDQQNNQFNTSAASNNFDVQSQNIPSSLGQQQPSTTTQDFSNADPKPTEEVVGANDDASYVVKVGRSMVDLLTDISVSDTSKQQIAEEMKLSVDQVNTICTKLLDKIDNGDITEEDLAFLMTAPIADKEPSI